MAPIQTAPCCSACGSNAPGAPPRNLLPSFVLTALALAVALWASQRAAGRSGRWPSPWARFFRPIFSSTRTSSSSGSPASSSSASRSTPFRASWEPRRRPNRVLFTVLVGVGGGALLRAFGQPLAPWAAGRFLSLLSGAFELAGVFAFLAWALPVLAVRRSFGDPLSLHVLLGSLWAALAAVLSGAQSIFLAGHAESEIPGGLVEPFYAVALYGLVLSYVLGFASRMVPAFLGPPASHGEERAARRRAAGDGRPPPRGRVDPRLDAARLARLHARRDAVPRGGGLPVPRRGPDPRAVRQGSRSALAARAVRLSRPLCGDLRRGLDRRALRSLGSQVRVGRRAARLHDRVSHASRRRHEPARGPGVHGQGARCARARRASRSPSWAPRPSSARCRSPSRSAGAACRFTGSSGRPASSRRWACSSGRTSSSRRSGRGRRPPASTRPAGARTRA